MSKPTPIRPYAAEQVRFTATRVAGRESVAYTLSVNRTQGKKHHSEILENGSFSVPDMEARLWTPAELLVVASAHLPLPGDPVWFTDSLW